jgi:hypothetical protein
MIRKFALPAVIAGTLLAGTSVQASTLIVDDYSDSGTAVDQCSSFLLGQCVYRNPSITYPAPINITIPGPRLTDTQSGLSNVEGGVRKLEMTPSSTANAQMGISPSLEALVLNNASGISSTGKVTYNAGGAGLNLDANAFGFDSFIFQILAADSGFGNWSLNLELTSNLGVTSQQQQSSTLSNLNSSSTTAFFDLSAFDNIDFTDIDQVAFTLSGPAGFDVTIDQIKFTKVAPEPGTILGLLAFGTVGLVSRRRQK